MSDSLFYIIIGVAGIGLLGIMAWYFVLSKRINKDEMKYARELQKGTKQNTFSMEIIYQQLYVFYTRIPFIKRYLAKLRRRLEIINVEDEYITRKQSAAYLTKANT